MTRPKLKDVLAIVRGYDAGDTVYISVFKDGYSVGTDFPEGTYVQFVLGQNKRASVKKALDDLEKLVVTGNQKGPRPQKEIVDE